jgi:four helix bundle protein
MLFFTEPTFILHMSVKSAKELIVYQKAYALGMRVFELSKRFPPEERFALTSQIRRSSRSICLNLREAWAKRCYPAHFVSKLTDCDGENSETDAALDFAHSCEYLTDDQHHELATIYAEIGRMLGSMIRNPNPFIVDTNRSRKSAETDS